MLVNNAGVMPAGPFLNESEATTEAIFGVNVAGPLFGMRLALPGMIERGRGHIVNVASMAGKTEVPGLATYVASKHAVIGLTNAVRAELSGTGVTLTVVLPGIVDTELSSGIPIPAIMRFAQVKAVDVARAIVDELRGPAERGRRPALDRAVSGAAALHSRRARVDRPQAAARRQGADARRPARARRL